MANRTAARMTAAQTAEATSLEATDQEAIIQEETNPEAEINLDDNIVVAAVIEKNTTLKPHTDYPGLCQNTTLYWKTSVI
jgi:hypothetical protein